MRSHLARHSLSIAVDGLSPLSQSSAYAVRLACDPASTSVVGLFRGPLRFSQFATFATELLISWSIPDACNLVSNAATLPLRYRSSDLDIYKTPIIGLDDPYIIVKVELIRYSRA